ncbi:unnamed protein product [Prunus armeniaca]
MFKSAKSSNFGRVTVKGKKVVYTIINRAYPASKRLAPRQTRLLPCQRKTLFQGAKHLLKLLTADALKLPNLISRTRVTTTATCTKEVKVKGLCRISMWNFVQVAVVVARVLEIRFGSLRASAVGRFGRCLAPWKSVFLRQGRRGGGVAALVLVVLRLDMLG